VITPVQQLHRVITDNSAEPKAVEALRAAGVDVMLVWRLPGFFAPRKLPPRQHSVSSSFRRRPESSDGNARLERYREPITTASLRRRWLQDRPSCARPTARRRTSIPTICL